MKRLYHYFPMFILTLLATLCLLVFEITLFASNIILKPDIYVNAIDKYNVAEEVVKDLDEYFEFYSKPTMIPKEVFMNTITKESVNAALHQMIADSITYLTDEKAPAPVVQYDFTGMENSVTMYIEDYSEQNDIVKDEEYYNLINNTISTAKEQITDNLDVFMLYKLSNSHIAQSMHKYSKIIGLVRFTSGALLLIFVLCMFAVNRHHIRDMSYWVGTMMFCSSAMLLVPALFVQKKKYIDGFFMKTEHIYTSVTGILKTLLTDTIRLQSIICIIGVLLIIATLIIHAAYVRYCRKHARRHHHHHSSSEESADGAEAV